MSIEAKLDCYEAMVPAARRALTEALKPVRTFRKGATLQIEGDPAAAAFVIVDGLARSHRSIAGAGQQVLALHFAGDIAGLPAIFSGHPVHGLTALTNVTSTKIPKAALFALIEDQPQLGRLFWRDMARDAVIAQEWMVGLGRRSAYGRTAHLMCEIFTRQAATRVTTGADCPFPLSQSELADAVGLSIVHVNRVLQRLRSEGLIALASGTLTIRNWDGLANAAGFDPAYLAPYAKIPAMTPRSEPA